MIFEDKERTYNGPKSYIENDYEYLDRSSRVEAGRVRDFLNYWTSQLPAREAPEIVARIQSRDRRNYDSVTFEIILFALLSKLECSLEIHPDLANESSKHPDFLVTTPGGEEFYLEAVLASEFSSAEITAEKRKNVVLESIERLNSPNFFLSISAEGNPDAPPPGKALRGSIERWLEPLDPDQVAVDVETTGLDSIPTMTWKHEKWKIRFEAIPKKPEHRGKGQRVIGSLSGGARFVNSWEPIRDAVCSKGSRYGKLDRPFVVAVNVNAITLDRIDEMQALFGQDEYIFSTDNTSAQPEMKRTPNGAWNGPKGPQYTRVSGVWIFEGMNPWNMVSRKNTLYFNPWGTYGASSIFESVNHASVVEDTMRWISGRTLSEILEFHETWPE